MQVQERNRYVQELEQDSVCSCNFLGLRKERQRMIQDQAALLNIVDPAWNASLCLRGQMRREQSMSAMEF